MLRLPKTRSPMSATDIAVLNELLSAEQSTDPSLTEAEFFEYFSAQQILRSFRLSPDDVKSGIVGQESNKGTAGSDGGIDSMYVLVDGDLIRDVEQAKALKRQNAAFNVIFITSTKTPGFGLPKMLRIKDTAEIIFKIEKQPSDFSETFNAPLLEAIECFRESHRVLLPKHPTINVHFYYASCGDTVSLNSEIAAKAKDIEQCVKETLPTIGACSFSFVGARDLIKIFQKPTKETVRLPFEKSMTDSAGGRLALVKIRDFYKFICDETGDIRDSMFESNVRDYEGDVEVNKQIRHTLETPNDAADFWWLNNGITILSDKISDSRDELALDEPRIVNGLQTSREIFEYFRSRQLSDSANETRRCVVRIIESPDEALQDRIIKATNSQTKIPPQYLWASDDVQRDIEQHFRTKGFHYDRRRNSWKKSGVPLAKIVGMTELAQSVAAILLQEPDHARARPSRYFKKENYERVFNSQNTPAFYFICVSLRRKVEGFLKKHVGIRQDRNNMIFYVMMIVVSLHLKTIKAKTERIAEIEVEKITDATLEAGLEIIRKVYMDHGGNDIGAKGPDMVGAVKTLIIQRFSRKRSPGKTKPNAKKTS